MSAQTQRTHKCGTHRLTEGRTDRRTDGRTEGWNGERRKNRIEEDGVAGWPRPPSGGHPIYPLSSVGQGDGGKSSTSVLNSSLNSRRRSLDRLRMTGTFFISPLGASERERGIDAFHIMLSLPPSFPLSFLFHPPLPAFSSSVPPSFLPSFLPPLSEATINPLSERRSLFLRHYRQH